MCGCKTNPINDSEKDLWTSLIYTKNFTDSGMQVTENFKCLFVKIMKMTSFCPHSQIEIIIKHFTNQ